MADFEEEAVARRFDVDYGKREVHKEVVDLPLLGENAAHLTAQRRRVFLMSSDHPKPSFDERDVLERNAGIDRAVVASYKRLKHKLRQLGVEVRPRYTLDPPLGSGRPRGHRLMGSQPRNARSRNAVP